MKKLKTLIALGAILAPSAISARSLNADEARQIAADFIQKEENTFRQSRSAASTPLRLTLATQGGKISRSSTPAYYIFNVSDNNGYVIVSGDDNFNEILGYANNGTYLTAKSNPAMDFWLSSLAEEMANTPAKNNSQSRASLTMTEVQPLLTTTWGQDEPYNNDCWVSNYRPTIGQQPQHAPTGCVATAMAQVINYHKWPQNYGDFEYKWDLMLPSYNGSEAAESIDQVAKLMSHCGKSVNMSYGVDASSTSVYSIAPALINSFGYNKEKIQEVIRNNYGQEYIHQLLNTELKEGRPVIISGNYIGNNLGHVFVMDGCTQDGFFHINWGWGGYLDGYFRLTCLKPEDYSIGGSQEGYSFTLRMVTGIQPQKNTDEDPTIRPKMAASGDLALVGDWIQRGDTLITAYSSSINLQFTTINDKGIGFGNTGLGLFKAYKDRIHTKWTNLATGESIIKGSVYYSNSAPLGVGMTQISFNRVNTDILPGEKYEVSLVYHLDEDPEDVYHDFEFYVGRRSSVIFERSDDLLLCIYPEMPVMLKAELPTLADSIHINSNQIFSVTFTNISHQEYVGEVKWAFLNSEGNIVDNTCDYIMLDLLPDESITEKFTLYSIVNAIPGKYTIGLYDFRNNLISDLRNVELYEYTVELNEINFPDPIFREYVRSSYDRDDNGKLSSSELNNACIIQTNSLGISDFKGCELLPYLEFVKIINEKCTAIDLSNAEYLKHLNIHDTPLAAINIGEKKELTSFEVYNNRITELDLSRCPNVESINISNNQLIRLSVQGLRKLQNLYCDSNRLTQLDLTGLSSLKMLRCANNNLSTLDLAGFDNLIYLSANGNKLSGILDLSSSKKLETVIIYDNTLSKLILKEHPTLKVLLAYNNHLTGSLDISRCDSLIRCEAFDNSLNELICGKNKALCSLLLYNNQIEGHLDISEMENLEVLFLNQNRLEKISFYKNDHLKRVSLSHNQIEGSFDFSNLPSITELSLDNNKIDQLIYNYHPNLQVISVTYNQFTHFHTENFPALTYYTCHGQKVPITINTTNLDLSLLMSKGFETKRASDWYVYWYDKELAHYQKCQEIDNVLIIPEEAGEEVILEYKYLTNVNSNQQEYFTINLTREGFTAIDDITADSTGEITIEGNTIHTATDALKEVFNINGHCIYRGTDESISIDGGRGIYLIRIAGKTVKVAI